MVFGQQRQRGAEAQAESEGTAERLALPGQPGRPFLVPGLLSSECRRARTIRVHRCI